jgi:hypothetical protein
MATQMTFLDEDLPDAAKAAHELVEQAKVQASGVFGGGVKGHEASVVATDGSVTDGPARESKEYLADPRSSTCPHTRRR